MKYIDEEKYESAHKFVLDSFFKQHFKISNLGQFMTLILTIDTHINITWLNLNLHRTPFKKTNHR